MLKAILGGVRESIFKGKKEEDAPADRQASAPPAPVVQKTAVPDGVPILRLGDALYESNRDEEAESVYRSAFQSDAPAELVHRKLQRVVARIAAKYDDPAMLLVAPGDGSASASTARASSWRRTSTSSGRRA